MGELKHTILAVDDEPGIIESYKALLKDDYNLFTAESGEQALEAVKKENIELVILDVLMSGMDGIETLKKIRAINEDIDVVMITAVKTVKTAIDAMKLGAYDYLTKPFDIDELLDTIEKILRKRSLSREVEYLRSEVSKPVVFENIISRSDEMRRIFEIVQEMARNDATVLIYGESGTGKELIARAIHFNGTRKDSPFIAVDCASMPENLLESELFGYEKGAFTDASSQKLGKFELAAGGTIFLDEIGNLKLEMQGKLLRVLQEREIQRLGGTKTIKLDVRIISATNIDLKKAIKDGAFREDLYYRLNVVPIALPPLRNREKDIPLLADHFIGIHNKEFKKNVKGLTSKAMEYLLKYQWPGNVRELQNIIERLVALEKGTVISHKNLPLEILLAGKEVEAMKEYGKVALKHLRNQFEAQYILSILEKTNWNQTKTAKFLGIHRNTLIWKMNKLGIQETSLEKEK